MGIRGFAGVVLAALALGACTARPPSVEPPAVEQAVATSAPVPVRERIVVHGTGDVSLDPDYIPALRENGYAHAWSGLGGLFTADDLTIVNLECPVSTRGTAVEKAVRLPLRPRRPARRARGRRRGRQLRQQPHPRLRPGRPARLDPARARGRDRAGRRRHRPRGRNRARRRRARRAGGSRCWASAAWSRPPSGSRPRAPPAWPPATTSTSWSTRCAPPTRWPTSCS